MQNQDAGIGESRELAGRAYAQARTASEFLKSLSHENRLIILCHLSEGEKAVNELEDILSLPQAAVSQHLARLRDDRLVKTRREGRVVYYSVVDQRVKELVTRLYSLFSETQLLPGE